MKTRISKIATTASIAVVISLPTLWFLEHQIKYFLFFFEMGFIFLLSVFYSRILDVRFRSINGMPACYVDYLLLASSLSLFLLNLVGVHALVNIVLAMIVSSFLPGYVFLRLMNFRCLDSPFETFVLSFALSVPLSSVISSFLVPIAGRAPLMGIVYVFLSFLPMVKREIGKRSEFVDAPSKASRTYDVSKMLIIGLMIISFSFTISTLYPQMAWLGGLDIAEHYSEALLFSRFPHSVSSLYPFFVIFEATVIELSNPSMAIGKTALAYMSVMIVLSFYMMARIYLRKIDSRLPITATVAWFLFSGFGWLYFLQQKLTQHTMSQMSMLWWAYDKSYADVGYGISTNLWLWFLPMTVSFTIFFTLIYLLKRMDISKRSFVPIFSLLTMALFFTHTSELVMFVVLLVALSFFAPKIKLRLHDALFSTLIGLASVMLLNIFYSIIGITVAIPQYVMFAMFIVTFSAYLLVFRRWKGLSIKKQTQITKMFAYAWLIVAIAGLFSWFPLSESFSMSYVGDTFLVPWFFHPVRLGVIGLLGAMVIIGRNWKNDIAIFPYLFFTSFIAGRVVSFINVNFFRTEYWEWRFLFFSFAAASVMSTLILKHIGIQAEKIQFKDSLGRICLCSLLIGFLILSGVSSTFLTIEHTTYNVSEMDEHERNAISFLSSTLLNREPSPLFTVTRESANALKLVPSPWVEKSIQPIIWSPKYPEVPLTFIYNLRFPPPYIYLHQRDLDIITNTWLQDGYIAEHFLQLMTEIYSNSKVKIYEQVSEAVPPLHNGETVLVLPINETFSWSYPVATQILSLGGYNYTTMLDSDPAILERDILLFPSDSITTANIGKLESSNRKKILILNSDGYGSLSRLFFESQETEASIDIKSGKSVFVHSLTNHTSGQTSISEHLFAGGIEFIMYNDEQKVNYISIADDDQAAFWTSTGGLGIGSISAPLLGNDSSAKMEGKDCLEMTIDEGDYSDWFIQHNYQTSQNWSNKDFLTMWWHGKDSGQTIGILAAGLDWKDYFQYTFIDDFIGWRRMVIPLRRFMLHETPRWDSIQILQIRSFDGGIAGKWYLDSTGLEDGNAASVEVTTNETPGEPSELSVFDGMMGVPMPLPQINSTIEIPANNLYFSDGSSAEEIFGEEYHGEARLEKIGDMHRITLSLKLPPKCNGLSQSRFRVGYETEKMNATHLVIPETEMPLPQEVELTSLIQREETNILGWYADGLEQTPLVATQMFGDQIEVFYLNVYPIVRTAFSGESDSQDLLHTLASLLDILELPEYDKTLTSWVIEDDTPVFAFREGSLRGNVSISAESFILFETLSLSEVHMSINNSQVLLKDAVSLSVQNFGGEIALSSQNVEISDGRGFYTFISADDPEITITGDDISISALASNGTYVSVEGSAEARLSVKGSFFTYLRSPSIHNMGESSFREVYAFHSYLGQLRTLGQDLLFEGEVEFNLPLSDAYSVASDFTWDGTVTRDPEDFTWDEVGSLAGSIPYFTLAIAVFSVAWIATQKNLRIRVRRRKS